MLDHPLIPGFDDVRFNKGFKLTEDLPLIQFTKASDNDGELLDWIPTALAGLTISARFKAALDSAGVTNVDYYPAVIKDEATGKVHDDIFVANIIGRIACVDMEKSRYRPSLLSPDRIRPRLRKTYV